MKGTSVNLYDYQIKALSELQNGSILCGGVGTGKSRTALAYYVSRVLGMSFPINGEGEWGRVTSPRRLFIITTAKKRDTREWETEATMLRVFDLVVDSWNNIKKYRKEFGAFFIFDEQRVVGKGEWVKAFLDITRKNKWILLSATPGDTWSDYVPVFIANGFLRNRTEFYQHHCVFNPYVKYQKIDRYVNTGYLIRCRNKILVRMDGIRVATPLHKDVFVDYDRSLYLTVFRDRWDPYDNCPIQEAGKLCYLLRKVVNLDESRVLKLKELLERHKRVIIFYNYDYELLVIRDVLERLKIDHAEWNGKRHEEVPIGDSWAYIVQYSAGAEGWNCITTDTIIFYSQTYSYRMSVQAAGRTDRVNTPFSELYYYHLKSKAPIDIAISRSLACKQNFNEKAFLKI